MYLDDTIVFDPSPALHEESIKAFLRRLDEYSHKNSPKKLQVAATTVDFLAHSVSSPGQRPDAKKG